MPATRRWAIGMAAVAAACLFAGAGLLGGEYMPDPSYVCNPPLDDLLGARPPVRQTEMFDPGPPCWDAAKRRVTTAAVVLPLMFSSGGVAAWMGAHDRRALLPSAAFALVALVALGAGWVTRY